MRKRPLPYDPEAARKHLLKADPVIREIVRSIGPFTIEVRGQPYESLVRAVLYQQLAGPAASAIERRFLAMYGDRTPTAEQLALATDEHLRTAGISRQKASYMRSIGEHFQNRTLTDRKLRRMSDEAIIEGVTQIRGVGRWTADMLLMFCIGRPDVLPVGDLGIQNAMKLAYGLETAPKPVEMEAIAEPWRPYRSAGSWYLWRRTDLVTL